MSPSAAAAATTASNSSSSSSSSYIWNLLIHYDEDIFFDYISKNPHACRVKHARLEQYPLHVFCEKQQASLRVVRRLHEAYPCAIRHADLLGHSPLHILCLYNNGGGASIAVMDFLIEKHFDNLKRPDCNGYLPLHYACWKKTSTTKQQRTGASSSKAEIVARLVRACPSTILARTNGGETPLDLAKMSRDDNNDNDLLLLEFLQQQQFAVAAAKLVRVHCCVASSSSTTTMSSSRSEDEDDDDSIGARNDIPRWIIPKKDSSSSNIQHPGLPSHKQQQELKPRLQYKAVEIEEWTNTNTGTIIRINNERQTDQIQKYRFASSKQDDGADESSGNSIGDGMIVRRQHHRGLQTAISNGKKNNKKQNSSSIIKGEEEGQHILQETTVLEKIEEWQVREERIKRDLEKEQHRVQERLQVLSNKIQEWITTDNSITEENIIKTQQCCCCLDNNIDQSLVVVKQRLNDISSKLEEWRVREERFKNDLAKEQANVKECLEQIAVQIQTLEMTEQFIMEWKSRSKKDLTSILSKMEEWEAREQSSRKAILLVLVVAAVILISLVYGNNNEFDNHDNNNGK